MFKSINFQSYKTIVFVGLFFRLLAAIFSEGYGMHDDHFLTIEASASWANHYDYNNWLPWTNGNRGVPEGHSFTYVGLNYLFFAFFKFFGLNNPSVLMIFNRIIHAFISILVVFFGIKITEKLSNRSNAIKVGWLLSLLWLMPFMSVRNLVEMVSIPFLMWGVWKLVDVKKFKSYLIGGILIGVAISFRYQIAVFSFGVAFFYLMTKNWKAFLSFSLGNVITFSLTQGVVDYFIWGYPFAEFIGYATYNMKEGTKYLPNSNYFMYFYVLFGVLLFPFGLLAGIGFFRSIRKYFFLFLPTMVFILFHTFYPNRQERFILSILPFFIILAVLGIEQLRSNAFFDRVWKFSWKAFWILNIPLLLFFTFTSTKYSRVEAMYSLYPTKKSNPAILMEGSGDASISMMPKFYANKWHASFSEKTVKDIDSMHIPKYDYIFFVGNGDLYNRVNYYKRYYPSLHLFKKCQPSVIDRVVHSINPRNVNEYIEIWAVK